MPRQANGRLAARPDVLVARARGEYLEMPGLRLTVAQACRLWQLNPQLCATVFDRLVSEGFLQRTDTGFYVVARDRARP
jgi:hypothetical protein